MYLRHPGFVSTDFWNNLDTVSKFFSSADSQHSSRSSVVDAHNYSGNLNCVDLNWGDLIKVITEDVFTANITTALCLNIKSVVELPLRLMVITL